MANSPKNGLPAARGSLAQRLRAAPQPATSGALEPGSVDDFTRTTEILADSDHPTPRMSEMISSDSERFIDTLPRRPSAVDDTMLSSTNPRSPVARRALTLAAYATIIAEIEATASRDRVLLSYGFNLESFERAEATLLRNLDAKGGRLTLEQELRVARARAGSI